MRKIFTLLSASVCAGAAMAASYTGTVSVNGSSSEATLQVTANDDGTYAVVVDGLLNIDSAAGNDDFIYYSDDNTTFKARMSGTYAAFDATVDGSTITFSNVGSAFQLPNSDFEEWGASSGEPRYWHGFSSASGSFKSLVKSTLASSTDKHGGDYSAVVTSATVWGVVGNGTVTNGRLNAGGLSATSTANHSEMDASDTDTDNYGDPFYMACPAKPDAIKSWIKFTQATASSSYPYATLSAVIFDGTYYQDPEDQTYTNVAAKAQNTNTITTGDWREVTTAFDYDSYASNNAGTGYILITISTNATPGQGSSGDQVFVDDLELVYNYGLSNVTYGGSAVSDGDAFSNVTTAPVASDFAYTSAGVGSLSGVVIRETPIAWVATVYSTAADLAGSDVLTVTFNKPVLALEDAAYESENTQVIVAEAIVAANKDDYVYVTDNNNNWLALNVTDADLKASMTEGKKVSKFVGTLSNTSTNPVLDLTYADAVTDGEDVAYTAIDLTSSFYARPNGIYYVTGYIDAYGKLRAYSGVNGLQMGQSLVINTKYVPNQTFVEGSVYKILAVFTINEPWTITLSAPARISPYDERYFDNYTIYPLSEADVAIATGVDDLNETTEVKSVRYYNLAGQQSDALQPGVNVVVKTLSNGNTQVEKVMK